MCMYLNVCMYIYISLFIFILNYRYLYAQMPQTYHLQKDCNRATRSKLPSNTRSNTQFEVISEVFDAPRFEIHHPVVFDAVLMVRNLSQGRGHGMHFQY